jgi:hypothetical protein
MAAFSKMIFEACVVSHAAMYKCFDVIELHIVCVHIVLFPWRDSPWSARASSLSRLHYHTQTHHTRQDSSGRVIRPSQRPLPDNTQHSQETDIHAPAGIRTHNASKRTDVDPRLRPRCYWGRQPMYIYRLGIKLCSQTSNYNIQTNNDKRIYIYVFALHVAKSSVAVWILYSLAL